MTADAAPLGGADADARFMDRALALAEEGRGRVSPNPMVGCVLVAGGEVVGEGWHRRAGAPHAEIEALTAAAERARGATAYVTLEPCNHQGRTPPCTEALLTAGVGRVVIAALDPNPNVRGGGAERLEAAGVPVTLGVRGAEASAQNEAFFTAHRELRPFVLYKTAMTLDGKLATRTGRSRWITGEAARARVQRWRDEFDGVVVGINTVLLDDPQLTARVPGGRTPVKVVFDSVARTPSTAKLLEPDERGEAARVVIFATDKAAPTRVSALRERGAEVVIVPERQGRADLGTALAELLRRDVTSLLLEGGGTLAWAFFEARAVDRVAWFIGPKLLGGSGATPLGGLGVAHMEDAFLLDGPHTESLDGDLLVTGRVRYPAPERDAGTVEAERPASQTRPASPGATPGAPAARGRKEV